MQVKTLIAALAFAAASAASFAQAPVAATTAPAAAATVKLAAAEPAKPVHHVAAKRIVKHPIHKVARVPAKADAKLTKMAHHPATPAHIHHTRHVVHAHTIVHHA